MRVRYETGRSLTMLQVPSKAVGDDIAIYRSSGQKIIAPQRSSSAHLRRPGCAIAQARRLANFVAVDLMLARIPSLDTPKAPATEGLAECGRIQTEQIRIDIKNCIV